MQNWRISFNLTDIFISTWTLCLNRHRSLNARICRFVKLNGSMVSLLLFLFTASGCEQAPDHNSFGLPLVFSLYIDDDALFVMQTSLQTKPKVYAEVWINGTKYRAKVLHSGATSVKSYRKNFELHLETPFEGMKIFRLNFMPGDFSAMKSAMAYHAYELVGFDMPRYEPAAVYINDEYGGLYQLQQKYTEPDYWQNASAAGDFPIFLYQAKKGLKGDETEIFANLEQNFSVESGTKEFVALKALVEASRQAPTDEGRAKIERIADVDQILLYMAMVQYLSHRDGVTNNCYFVLTNKNPRFRIFPWDLDHTFSRITTPESGIIFERNYLMNRFFYEDKPYREQFVNKVKYIHNRLTQRAMLEYLDSYFNQIKDAWEADYYLTASGKTLESFKEELEHTICGNRRSYQQYLKTYEN